MDDILCRVLAENENQNGDAGGQRKGNTHLRLHLRSQRKDERGPSFVVAASALRLWTTMDRVNPLQPSAFDAMLTEVPSLRAFAISLSRNVDRADDLVQEMLLRA